MDGGSEFAALFEQACQQRGLRLLVLPPRSPKLNGHVERAHRTHTEECYEVTPCSLQIAQLNQELQAWERTYNTVRPHQALGYRTPQEFFAQRASPSQHVDLSVNATYDGLGRSGLANQCRATLP